MRYVLIFALWFSLIAPALCDIEVGDIVINRKQDEVNVRVNMHNPGPHTARGPVTVRLYVRESESEEWREVKVWTNIQKLAVGHRVSRDYFNATPGEWDPAFTAPSFSVYATAVSSRGQESAFEKRYP